mgnify:CR=1 FL=1
MMHIGDCFSLTLDCFYDTVVSLAMKISCTDGVLEEISNNGVTLSSVVTC